MPSILLETNTLLMETWAEPAPSHIDFQQKHSLFPERSFSTTKNITTCSLKIVSEGLCKVLIDWLKGEEIAGSCHDFHSILLFPTLRALKNSTNDKLAKRTTASFCSTVSEFQSRQFAPISFQAMCLSIQAAQLGEPFKPSGF